MNYVLVPADKAAYNIVVGCIILILLSASLWTLMPINCSLFSERVIVDGHGCHTALHFGVKAKENQDKVPTLY